MNIKKKKTESCALRLKEIVEEEKREKYGFDDHRTDNFRSSNLIFLKSIG